MPMPSTNFILAADIGGTSGRFGWFTFDNDHLELADHLSVPTASCGHFTDMLEQVSREGPRGGIQTAVFAVAGAVEPDGSVHPPNIPWPIHRDMITPYFPHHTLINDFQAQAFGCRTDLVRHAQTIQPGTSDTDGVLAVMGAGTGLGHCILVPDGHGGHITVASEAGHAAFPLYGTHETEYLAFLRRETGRTYATGDMVVTGPGLSRLHAFLSNTTLSPAEVAANFHRFPKTLEWFARFYGRACRHYCLNVLPTRGLYISGGLAAKHPEMITHEAFITEFLDSRDYHDLLKRIPVHLNREEAIGLWGAAAYGCQQMYKGGRP